MIEIHNLQKAFGENVVLQNVNLQIPDSARLCLIGGSGSGKSVLVRCLLGLENISGGEIRINGKLTKALKRHQWRYILDQFGVVFQHSALFDSLSIRENVGIKLYENRSDTPDNIERRIVNALTQVQLRPDILHRFPAELSGGMQKRVAIARAIVAEPSYLIFDEPTTGLDPVSKDRIDELMLDLAEEERRTTIVVTHDMQTLRHLATQVAMLYQGSLCFSGTPKDFWISERPEVQAFLRRSR